MGNRNIHPLTDDIAALACVIGGLALIFIDESSVGLGVMSTGTGYIFGKNIPNRK